MSSSFFHFHTYHFLNRLIRQLHIERKTHRCLYQFSKSRQHQEKGSVCYMRTSVIWPAQGAKILFLQRMLKKQQSNPQHSQLLSSLLTISFQLKRLGKVCLWFSMHFRVREQHWVFQSCSLLGRKQNWKFVLLASRWLMKSSFCPNLPWWTRLMLIDIIDTLVYLATEFLMTDNASVFFWSNQC